MIEEQGLIVAAENEFAWVETERRTSCGSCVASSSCGINVIGKVIGAKRTRVKVLNTISAAIGDEVVIGVEEQALLKGSLAIYIVPLIFMFVCALLGDVLAKWTLGNSSDLLSSLFGVAGLAVGFLWQRYFGHRIRRDERYIPVVIRSGKVIN